MRPRSASPGVEPLFERHRQACESTIRSLKIALIAHLKFPIAQPYGGGLEMHTHLLARKLTEREHDVTLFAARGSEFGGKTIAICDPTGALIGAQELRQEQAAYEAIVNRIAVGDFDIVHNNSLHPWPLHSLPRLPPMVTVLHTPPFMPLAAGAADATGSRFVAVSKSVAKQWRGIIDHADIIPNGVELQTFMPGDARIEPPRAIWFGRIVPEKGLHLALDAARLASLPIDVAGPVCDRAYWAQEIAPRFNADVNYLGHLDHAALRWHISRAAVALVTPRWEEPFGLVAAEALATGTPVAAFRRGALPEVIGDAGCLAQPDDAADLARAATDALRIDPALCRRRAEEALDCGVMIARYEAIYSDMHLATPVISAAAG